MVISASTTTIIYIILAICFVAPLSHLVYMTYQQNVAGGQVFENRAKPHLIIMLLIILLFSTSVIFCPKIYHITNCGEYTEKKVIFPNDKYSLGTHNYVNNQSSGTLYLEHVAFDDAKLSRERHKNLIIKPNEIAEINDNIKFLFEPIPKSMLVQNTRSKIFLSLGCKPYTNPYIKVPPFQQQKPRKKITPPKIVIPENIKNSDLIKRNKSKKDKPE